MSIKFYDYLVDEETELDTADIAEVRDIGNGHSYIENVDGLIYEVDNEVLLMSR